MKYIATLLLITTAFLFSSCGHTNELEKYDLKDKSFLYQYRIPGNAVDASTWVSSPTDGPAAIITIIGSSIAGDEAVKKLERAANPDTLALALSKGIENVTSTYIGIRRAKSLEENPDFIVETVLDKYELHSSDFGISVKVDGTTRVAERGTGKIIWEYDESETISMSDTWYAGMLGPGSTVIGAFNIARLLNLPDSQLRAVLKAAAEEAGAKIAEEFRDDYADARR
jgi:hypothetical protein